MLEISDRSTPECLVVRIEGNVTGDEYERFSDAFEARAEADGQVNLVVELSGSVGYGDREAFGEDFEFAFKEYRAVRRAAFVGDQKLIRALMKLFSPFTRAEERFFDVGDLEAAIAWACAAE